MIQIIKNKVFETLLKNNHTYLQNDEIVITCTEERHLRVGMLTNITLSCAYFILTPSHLNISIHLPIILIGELECLLNEGSEFFINYLINQVNNTTMLKLK